MKKQNRYCSYCKCMLDGSGYCAGCKAEFMSDAEYYAEQEETEQESKMTKNKGLVIKYDDGTEFQVTIVQR